MGAHLRTHAHGQIPVDLDREGRSGRKPKGPRLRCGLGAGWSEDEDRSEGEKELEGSCSGANTGHCPNHIEHGLRPPEDESCVPETELIMP